MTDDRTELEKLRAEVLAALRVRNGNGQRVAQTFLAEFEAALRAHLADQIRTQAATWLRSDRATAAGEVVRWAEGLVRGETGKLNG